MTVALQLHGERWIPLRLWSAPRWGLSDLQSGFITRGCYVNAEQTHHASRRCSFMKLNHVCLTAGTNPSMISKTGKIAPAVKDVYVDLRLEFWMETICVAPAHFECVDVVNAALKWWERVLHSKHKGLGVSWLVFSWVTSCLWLNFCFCSTERKTWF